MNCDAIVSKGHLAWLPTRKAMNLDAFHVHDVPLIGTFEVDGEPVLFTCLTGATSQSSIWAYLPIYAAEVAEIDALDFESTQDLELYLHDLFVNRRAVIANVFDGRIRSWGAEDVDDEGVLEAAVRWMNLLLAEAAEDEPAKRIQRHQAEQARADATLQIFQPA